MKTILCIALSLLASGPARAQGNSSRTEEQKVLYALGAALGRNIGNFRLSPSELDSVVQGLKDQVGGRKLAVDLEAYGSKIETLAQSRQAAGAEGEKKKGREYIQKNSKQKGAATSPSGLLFISTKEGSGASPQATDTVKVHYHGTLTSGTVFDSSVQRGQPAEFPLNRVIPCWTEGVQKIKVGGKAVLVCPSEIAYGDGGRPSTIPGGATLVFEVELLDIVKK